MGTLKKTVVLCVLAGNNVDITVDMDTNVDMGEQETEMP